MTFDEWWKSKKTLIETVVNNNKSHIDLIVFIKSIMNIAWQAAQPKWTYCKDGMPTEKDGKFEGTGIFKSSVFNILHSNGTVSSLYYYLKLKAFGTSDGVKVYSCNDVVAWMSLPEVQNDYNGV